jgi:AcrR family transcriptional regulator
LIRLEYSPEPPFLLLFIHTVCLIKSAAKEGVNLMSPRPYHLGKRQGPVDAARQQVLDAARRLLGGTASYTAFTVDAVARRADVARATVYYQFGSKAGLLEALCDHLAEIGGLAGLADAFTEPDALQALHRFVACFGRFWAADRPAMRRLRALALLDPDVGAVIAARDQRRQQGLTLLAGRLAPEAPDHAVRVLTMLTSFETFDTLAGSEEITAAIPDILRLAETVLGQGAGGATPTGA